MLQDTMLATKICVAWMNRATVGIGRDMDCSQVVDQVVFLDK
jgi:hypothetical protein